MDLSDPQTLTVLAVLASAGAVLGGAVGHWRRGRAMILTGAIIGTVLLPLIGLGAMLFQGVILMVTLLALAVVMAFNFLAG